MRADDLRILYDYHFALNRKMWDNCVMALTDEEFTRQLDYSVGSIRNQMVHMLDVDGGWFRGLQYGVERGPWLNAVMWPERAAIRAEWDKVEADMKAYLDSLTDEEAQSMFPDSPQGHPVAKWQIMLHVLNHGTDHRAQVLAGLHQLGAPTIAQDMIWHFWPV